MKTWKKVRAQNRRECNQSTRRHGVARIHLAGLINSDSLVIIGSTLKIDRMVAIEVVVIHRRAAHKRPGRRSSLLCPRPGDIVRICV